MVFVGSVGSAALCEGRQRTQPVGLSIMLRTYFVQQLFNLSDPGVEEALYESSALRRFVGVSEPVGATVCLVARDTALACGSVSQMA
jgi:hypothetical protein